MLSAVKGYYDGSRIVIDEEIKMTVGQEVIITILEGKRKAPKRDLSEYMGRGEKLFSTDAQRYVEGLRSDDRI